jgi:hypothetical protein
VADWAHVVDVADWAHVVDVADWAHVVDVADWAHVIDEADWADVAESGRQCPCRLIGTPTQVSAHLLGCRGKLTG